MMNGRQWSFIDMLTMFDTFLQVADFQMNVQQSSNDDIMRELQHQNKAYLEKIIKNQEEILSKLADISQADYSPQMMWVDYKQRGEM